VRNEGLNAEGDEKSSGGGNSLTSSLSEVNTPSVGSSNPGSMSGIVRRIKKGNLKAANKVRAKDSLRIPEIIYQTPFDFIELLPSPHVSFLIQLMSNPLTSCTGLSLSLHK
jgi:hypothetical protein